MLSLCLLGISNFRHCSRKVGYVTSCRCIYKSLVIHSESLLNLAVARHRLPCADENHRWPVNVLYHYRVRTVNRFRYEQGKESSKVVEVTEGGSVILNCSQNSIVLEDKQPTVHWRHNDTRNVFDIINGNVSIKEQDPAYKNRAEIVHEELKKGKVFLKLTDLQLSDGGMYLCFVPDLGLEHSTQLLVKERCMMCTTAEITSHGAGARLGKTLYLLIQSSGFIVLCLI
ncbi:uncharacterized protein LOC127988183 [Carassius gibelio]|uniref:uncharacterized protein LOC127988183 n=1 Tax=Carassius gibelio TaxID=101364 RepID=UPI0022788EA2|nr:uncharacterized protein LOC127988183 [Carassius gibelio]